jgi:hypothetical protein
LRPEDRHIGYGFYSRRSGRTRNPRCPAPSRSCVAMTLKTSHMCEYPMRLGYVSLSAHTPCDVRPSISGTGRVLSVFRSPVAGRLLSARRQCGRYPSPGCLRAVAHQQRRNTDSDLTHSGSKELRSIVQPPTHIRGCRFGGPALHPGADPPGRQSALAVYSPATDLYVVWGRSAKDPPDNR